MVTIDRASMNNVEIDYHKIASSGYLEYVSMGHYPYLDLLANWLIDKHNITDVEQIKNMRIVVHGMSADLNKNRQTSIGWKDADASTCSEYEGRTMALLKSTPLGDSEYYGTIVKRLGAFYFVPSGRRCIGLELSCKYKIKPVKQLA